MMRAWLVVRCFLPAVTASAEVRVVLWPRGTTSQPINVAHEIRLLPDECEALRIERDIALGKTAHVQFRNGLRPATYPFVASTCA
jgi:hypothetical protein